MPKNVIFIRYTSVCFYSLNAFFKRFAVIFFGRGFRAEVEHEKTFVDRNDHGHIPRSFILSAKVVIGKPPKISFALRYRSEGVITLARIMVLDLFKIS